MTSIILVGDTTIFCVAVSAGERALVAQHDEHVAQRAAGLEAPAEAAQAERGGSLLLICCYKKKLCIEE